MSSTASMPWAVVINPSKFTDLAQAKAEVSTAATELGWDEPTWFETTEDDPGAGQARQAVDTGAQLVCAMGGDGTVRTVAGALRDTDASLAILAAGTGNLLARNLGLPFNSIDRATRVALSGHDIPIDVGLIRFDDGPEEPFFVMAGVGLDAEIMAATHEGLKNTIGWLAYLGGTARALVKRGFTTRLRMSDGITSHSASRMVLICNCPQLTAGLTMAVDGTLDDGLLDTVVVRVYGPVGWLAAIWDLVTGGRGRRRRLKQRSGGQVQVLLSRPVAAEMDGDLHPEPVSRIRARVDHHALRVRVGAAESQDRNLISLVADSITG